MPLGETRGEIVRPKIEDTRIYPYDTAAPECPVRETFTEEQIDFVTDWLEDQWHRRGQDETCWQLRDQWRDEMATK